MDLAPDATATAIVPVLSCVLNQLCTRNDRLPVNQKGISKFHALRPPAISIKEYLTRIAKYASCSGECFVLSLVYIDRVIQSNPTFVVNSLNIHRLLITSVMLAAKFFDDQYFNNAYFAKVGGVPCNEMNSLEVEFLFMTNFTLFVATDTYRQYYTELCNHAANGACGCSTTKVPALELEFEDSTPISSPISSSSSSSSSLAASQSNHASSSSTAAPSSFRQQSSSAITSAPTDSAADFTSPPSSGGSVVYDDEGKMMDSPPMSARTTTSSASASSGSIGGQNYDDDDTNNEENNTNKTTNNNYNNASAMNTSNNYIQATTATFDNHGGGSLVAPSSYAKRLSQPAPVDHNGAHAFVPSSYSNGTTYATAPAPGIHARSYSDAYSPVSAAASAFTDGGSGTGTGSNGLPGLVPTFNRQNSAPLPHQHYSAQQQAQQVMYAAAAQQQQQLLLAQAQQQVQAQALGTYYQSFPGGVDTNGAYRQALPVQAPSAQQVMFASGITGTRGDVRGAVGAPSTGRRHPSMSSNPVPASVPTSSFIPVPTAAQQAAHAARRSQSFSNNQASAAMITGSPVNAGSSPPVDVM